MQSTKKMTREVSGLRVETQPIEGWASSNEPLSTRKIAGLQKSGSVTLKRGVIARDNTPFAAGKP